MNPRTKIKNTDKYTYRYIIITQIARSKTKKKIQKSLGKAKTHKSAGLTEKHIRLPSYSSMEKNIMLMLLFSVPFSSLGIGGFYSNLLLLFHWVWGQPSLMASQEKREKKKEKKDLRWQLAIPVIVKNYLIFLCDR